MLWQRVVFLLGLAPNLGLTAKLPNLPILGRQVPGATVTSSPNQAGGFVGLPQHNGDGGPAITLLQATFPVPNLTFASGQGSTGGPYQLSLGCNIDASTDGSSGSCDGNGPHVGIHANLSGDGSMSYQTWFRWGHGDINPITSDTQQELNLTTGDSFYVEISLSSGTDVAYSAMNLKNTSNQVNWTYSGGSMCSGDGTTAYAGCYLHVDDTSVMPGFVELDFESIFIYDRSNKTHDIDIDQQVSFYQLVNNGKTFAAPLIEEPHDFAIEWSENPSYGLGDGGNP
ncbi:Structure-specific endonuclease subunit SLX1 [Apiospora arundinis]